MVSVLEPTATQQETSPHKPRAGALVVPAAIIIAAALLWFGTGLAPVAWLTWLAPLPLFAIAARVRVRVAALAAFAAWALGSLNMWTYYAGTLEVPAIVVIIFLLLQALMAAGAVALFGALLRRGRLVLAVLAAPALWAAAEYAVSQFSPGGSFASTGYTQTEILPVVQLTSLTGIWGVSYLLMAVPALIAAAALARPGWRKLLPLSVGIVLLPAVYGFWQLQAPSAEPLYKVALVNVDQPEDSLPLASPLAQQILSSYLNQAPAVAAAGARIMVLPEKIFKVTSAELGGFSEQVNATAASTQLTIVIGLTLKEEGSVHNVAMAYTGNTVVRYDKHHLVTGWEDHITAGTSLAFLPGTTAALAICKDLDHPSLARSYAQAGMTMLLTPALDFDRDGWLHSRIAIVRGVEDGVPVVRSAGDGRLTASDAYGRVVADVIAGPGTTAVVAEVAEGAGRTLYSSLGDWFAWACVAIVVWAVTGLRRRGAMALPVISA